MRYTNLREWDHQLYKKNMRVLAAQINPIVGDIEGNSQKILSALKRAQKEKIEIILFPELTLCGYFPDDLLLDKALIGACEKKLEEILPKTGGLFAVIGLPRFNKGAQGKPLHNSVAVFADGKFLGFKDKTLLPTYDVFDERRYFEPGREEKIWSYRGKKIGITICEDAWQHARAVEETFYQRDPILELKEKGVDLLLNSSGSPFYFERKDTRIHVFQAAARTLGCPVVFCNQVGANDQLIFDGHSLAINSKGELIQMAKGFVEEDLLVHLGENHPEQKREQGSAISDLHDALVLGVRDYFHKQQFKTALLGISGGIDSAVCACIAVEALGKGNVFAYTLPSEFTSEKSLEDAHTLAKRLEIPMQEISISELFAQYLDLLEPKFSKQEFDITEENLQARIRMMILMAFSNKEGPIMLYAGDKSEMAMGYTTLYGDLAGGLGVLVDVTKSRVYEIGKYINREKKVIPERIFTKAPSPELKKGQTAADSLPVYEILDPIIEDYIEKQLSIEEIAQKRGHSLEFIKKIVHQIHAAEYKRRQAPIGLRVTRKAFSKGRYVPIVQKWL